MTVMLPPAPMLAASAPAPFDSEAYTFEVKWDGVRCLAVAENGSTRLFSRTGKEMTRQFPELAELHRAVAGDTTVLDGELCVLNGTVPDFHRVQRRLVLGTDIAVAQAAEKHPALYVVFDLLRIDGHDMTGQPLSTRRRALEDSWRGNDYAILSAAVPTRGKHLYAAAVAQGLEGIVAKRTDSPYVAGRRTDYWLKIRHELELDGVVGGYVPKGAADFKSLAIGLHTGKSSPIRSSAPPLVYVGHVGTGFSARLRGDIVRRLLPLRSDASPFIHSFDVSGDHKAGRPDNQPLTDTVWVRPELVCRLRYLQFTPAGRLRHPVFLGLRDDKLPSECTRPPTNRQAAENFPNREWTRP